ncbi:MAG TPA: hypothetical protein VJN67_19265 [Stellaceae bacterium]|nr:hypothetical protein [Stellaceae bacterium]
MRQRLLLIALGTACAAGMLGPRPAEAAQACGPWVGRTVTLAGRVHWNDYDAAKNRYSIVLQDACDGLVNISGAGALPCRTSPAVAVTGRLEAAPEDAILLEGDYLMVNPARVDCR